MGSLGSDVLEVTKRSTASFGDKVDEAGMDIDDSA